MAELDELPLEDVRRILDGFDRYNSRIQFLQVTKEESETIRPFCRNVCGGKSNITVTAEVEVKIRSNTHHALSLASCWLPIATARTFRLEKAVSTFIEGKKKKGLGLYHFLRHVENDSA